MLKFAKVREVKDPCRAHATDAGIDFFVPEHISAKDLYNAPGNHKDRFFVDVDGIVIKAHSRVNIPSGVHYNIDAGHALVAFNKSGIATKHGLVVGACVGDEDYQGEFHISVINTSANQVIINFGQKLLQALYLPIKQDMPEIVPFKELYTEVTDRGDGGFGSSDIK